MKAAFKTTPLRLAFWSCWAGTAALPIIALLLGITSREPTDYAIIPFFSMAGLCFVSARCLEREPRLVRFGMTSLPIIVMLTFIEAIPLGPITS